jgi:hypothetical protein
MVMLTPCAVVEKTLPLERTAPVIWFSSVKLAGAIVCLTCRICAEKPEGKGKLQENG